MSDEKELGVDFGECKKEHGEIDDGFDGWYLDRMEAQIAGR